MRDYVVVGEVNNLGGNPEISTLQQVGGIHYQHMCVYGVGIVQRQLDVYQLQSPIKYEWRAA